MKRSRKLARSVRIAWIFLFFMGILLLASATAFAQTEAVLDVVEIDGIIDPVTEDYLSESLESAEEDGVHAIVLQMDTPGGLDVSMREIVQDILDENVPVIVWVAPRGARAASAGTFIAYAANLAYMAESTEIGAATPVNLGGGDVLEQKVVNDAAAFLREIAITRGRNAEWAERAVTDAASLGATEAARIGVVDGVASSLDELLRQMDGESVEVADGTTAVLQTWSDGAPSVTVRFQDMNPLQQLLHVVTNPEFAYLLLLIGAFGIIFELYNPGIGLAGILGAVALLLGFYALSILPTNWAGVGLIALSILFFVVDLQTVGLGAWTVGGTAALIAGGLLLFADADPELQLSPLTIVLSVLLTALFFFSVMTAALRVRLRRPVTGEDGIVGMVGEAKTDIAPEGTVATKGTLWRARTMETGIEAGSKVRVKAMEGLVLLVEPLHESDESVETPSVPGRTGEPHRS
ncbi:MAG: nodulation protein NfeD [Actinomycetota bacterium]|nr:nodulation protein NfeD [Actinomycetota bacterium]